MPHWLALLLTAAGGFTTLVAFVVATRKTAGWVRRNFARALALLEEIRTASSAFGELNLRLHELAGSILQLVVPMIGRQEAHDAQLLELNRRVADFAERMDTYAELYTDLVAALARLRRREEAPRNDEPDPP